MKRGMRESAYRHKEGKEVQKEHALNKAEARDSSEWDSKLKEKENRAQRKQAGGLNESGKKALKEEEAISREIRD